MATVECSQNKIRIYLQSCHIFGRNPVKADTVLLDKDVSQIHASLRWDGTTWLIIDHSKNGTFIDDKRLPKGECVKLEPASQIRFGGTRDRFWRIIDLAPPSPFLFSLKDDSQIIRLCDYQILPDEKNPEIYLYHSGNGKWVYEKDAQVGFLNNGDIVEINSTLWRFSDSIMENSTIDNAPVYETNNKTRSKVEFLFYVSPDEEHVKIQMTCNSRTFSLGERSHHYLLLNLARRKIDDKNKGYDLLSHGWIDMQQLLKMHCMNQFHINIQIFRARQQVMNLLPEIPDMVHIIERRTGEVRFGISMFKIFSGTKLEGKYISTENQMETTKHLE